MGDWKHETKKRKFESNLRTQSGIEGTNNKEETQKAYKESFPR